MTLTPSQPRMSQVNGNSRDHKTRIDSLEVPREDWGVRGGREGGGGESDVNISLDAFWPVPAYRSVLYSDLFLRIIKCYILTCSCISSSATFWPVPVYCPVLPSDLFLCIVQCYFLTCSCVSFSVTFWPVPAYCPLGTFRPVLFLRIIQCYILTCSCVSFIATVWPVPA